MKDVNKVGKKCQEEFYALNKKKLPDLEGQEAQLKREIDKFRLENDNLTN